MTLQAHSTVRLLRHFIYKTLFTPALLTGRRLTSAGDVEHRARSVQPIPNKEPAWTTAEEAVSVITSGRVYTYLYCLQLAVIAQLVKELQILDVSSLSLGIYSE